MPEPHESFPVERAQVLQTAHYDALGSNRPSTGWEALREHDAKSGEELTEWLTGRQDPVATRQMSALNQQSRRLGGAQSIRLAAALVECCGCLAAAEVVSHLPR